MAPFPAIFLVFSNRTLLLLLAVAILFLPIWYFFGENTKHVSFVFDNFLVYTCLALLLKNGSFVKTSYARFVNLGFAVILMGALLKIMHWPGANELLIFGFSLIFILYLIHFIMGRKYQTVFGIVKLLLVLLYLGSKLFTLFHLPHNTLLQMVATILLFIVVGSFILLNFQKLIKS